LGRKTSRRTSSSSWAWRSRTSTGPGTSENTGHAIAAVQSRVKHPVIPRMAAILYGMVTETGAI
jgi:hypothetical protein